MIWRLLLCFAGFGIGFQIAEGDWFGVAVGVVTAACCFAIIVSDDA